MQLKLSYVSASWQIVNLNWIETYAMKPDLETNPGNGPVMQKGAGSGLWVDAGAFAHRCELGAEIE
jgi:hypothetical protein